MGNRVMSEPVGLIDYGSGNFTSVWNAFQKHGRALVAITQPSQLAQCSHVVLPGVGSFSMAVDCLTKMKLIEPIKELIVAGKTPFLGICVGMQLLATKGTEFHPTNGLNAVSGVVDRFDFQHLSEPLPLPHMGWNDVHTAGASVLFKGIDLQEPSFYFVHSYHLQSNDPTATFSYCSYGMRFIAAVEKNRIFGVQFHPEKSQRNGHRLIANFLEVTRG